MEKSSENKVMTKFTLIFVLNGEHVLLGYKKRGFGVGKWNGFGGKVEKDETIVKGAVRELKEESNLDVADSDMKYLGYVQYERANSPQVDIVYIFTTSNASDDFCETEEMAPKWFKISEIPYDVMWPDSKYWLPIVLKNKGLLAKFLLSGERTIEEKIINEIEAPTLTEDKNSDG